MTNDLIQNERHKLAYSIPEAKAATGLSVAFLYRLMQAGRLRYTKIGTRRVIPKSALLELVEGQVKPAKD